LKSEQIYNLNKKMKFKFIDLFAGIGGFHQAMIKSGGESVFASEIDKNACEVYETNYNLKPFKKELF